MLAKGTIKGHATREVGSYVTDLQKGGKNRGDY